MPRLATLLRPLRSFSSDLITPESHTPPGELIRCPYCSRMLKCDGDLTRHLTLRASCRREEERAARAQVTSEVDFWSIVEAIGQARIETETRLGGRLKAKSEAQSEEVLAAEVFEAEVPEAQAEVAEMEVEGPGEPTTGREATPPDEPVPAGHAEPDIEPPSEHVPAEDNGASLPPGAPDGVLDLVFDKNEGDYVEYYPDPRAGAPINNKTVEPFDLDAYMAAAGNLGDPFYFNTAELLLTTGLTGEACDEHLRSEMYEGRTPWKSNKALMDEVDNLPHGPSWAVYELKTQFNGRLIKKSYLFTRHIVEVVCDMMANPAFTKFVHFAPQRRYKTADRRNRVYGNPWTANWWWRTQMRIPDKSATIVPLIISSDRTRLWMMSGGQEAYPLYISLANHDKSVRRKTSSGAMALLAYLPVDDFEGVTDAEEKAKLKNQLTHRAMEKVTEPLRSASKDGVEMLCADGWFRRGYPIVAGVMADWPEQCMMGCTSQSGCPKCIQKEKGRGDYRQRARPRTSEETLEALNQYFETGDEGELKGLGLKPWWPWWADLPYVDFGATLMPDMLHQLHQGMVKTHLVRWLCELVGKRRVDQCLMAMPEAEGMRHFGRGVSKLKGQWTGRESREVAKQLLPIAAGQRSRKLDPDLTGLTRAILEFSYRAHASRMTDEDVDELEKALEEIHSFKNVLIREELFADDSRFDLIAKLHMLSHYAEPIREMGTPDNFSTEAPEYLHIVCAKRPWRASNKVRPAPQMVKFVQRYEALRIHRAYMDRWLGVPANPRRRARKSRVIYEEEAEVEVEVERTAQRGQIQTGGGDGHGNDDSRDDGKGDTKGDIEAQERERREEEDEEAEGPKAQLEGRRRMGPDASQHVVYPDPALSIAVRPSGGRVSGADIVDKFGAMDFIRSLHSYLKKHTTRNHLPSFFLPTARNHFLVWHRLYLHHRPLPFDPEHGQRDVIRARPESSSLQSVFDVTLFVHREGKFGIHRYRAGRVRAIFSLPKELFWLCPHPLVHVELFTPFSSSFSPFHGMNTTSHALTPEGKRCAAVISIYDVVAACHLAPQFRRLDPDVRLDSCNDLLTECRYFYLNHFYNHYIFRLIEHWRSARAAARQNQ